MKKFFLVIILIIIFSLVGILIYRNLFKDDSKKETYSNSDNVNYSNTNKNENIYRPSSNEEGKLNEDLNTDENTDSLDIFGEYYEKANKIIETMTVEEKIGQMFLVRFPETGVLEEIEEYYPGGYIMFGRDFKDETKESILEEITNCQNASEIPMFFGVDEEGGTVVRVSAYKAFRDSAFKSPQALWQEGQLPLILEDSKEKSDLLESIGINMNLTPVADVPTNTSSFIYQRSYGRGAEKTAIYVSELIKTMNESNMISAMKHFPGYGDNVDTHTGIAIDERPYTEFENTDFLPFASGIEAGGPTILVSHNIINCMDEKYPASLSKEVHQILREELNFTGIIMTDDLAMDAVKSYVENGEAAVQAVLAGNDMIISSDFEKQRNEILNAVEDGKISEEIIDSAVRRILACKYKYGIIKDE